MRVTIVIPTKNEQAILKGNIERLLRFLADNGRDRDCAVVIADNGSTDATPAVAAALSAEHPSVSFFHLAESGRGRALKKAWSSGDTDIVGYMDADLSTDLEALPRALAELEAGADVVVGSRLGAGSRTSRSFGREVISRVYNVLVRRLLRSHVSDNQCGFKFLRRTAALRLLPLIKNDLWFFDTELVFWSLRLGLAIKELPVKWSANRKSTVKLLPTMIEEFSGVLRLRREAGRRRVI